MSKIIDKKDYGQTYQNTQKAVNTENAVAKSSQTTLPYGSTGVQKTGAAQQQPSVQLKTAAAAPSPSQGLQSGGFKFNINEDELYRQYADSYQRQAKKAAEDAQARAQAAAGGYGTSYGAMAGSQAYNNQMQGLNDRLPEIYQQAYNRYRDEVGDQQWQKQYDYDAAATAAKYGNYEPLQSISGGKFTYAENMQDLDTMKADLENQAKVLGIRQDQLEYLLTLAENGNYEPARAMGLDTTLIEKFNQAALQEKGLDNAVKQIQYQYYGGMNDSSGYGTGTQPAVMREGLYSDAELTGQNVQEPYPDAPKWSEGYNPTNGVYGDYTFNGRTNAADARQLERWSANHDLYDQPIGVNATNEGAQYLLGQTARLNGGLPENKKTNTELAAEAAAKAEAEAKAKAEAEAAAAAAAQAEEPEYIPYVGSLVDDEGNVRVPQFGPSGDEYDYGYSGSSYGGGRSGSSGSGYSGYSGGYSGYSGGSGSSSSTSSGSSGSSAGKYDNYFEAANELAGVTRGSEQWNAIKKKYGITSDAILGALVR